MLPAIMRLKCNIFLVFCLSLIIGFFSEFGSFLSLSRTICFGGYFLLGCYCKENVFGKIKESKKMVFCVTVIISILLFVFFTSKYGISHARDIIITLRRSSAYKNMEIDRINGFLFRVITIPLSILFSIFILAFIPNTKTIFTGLGKRSVIIFVFHGYFIRLIEKTININSDSLGGIMLLILFSIGITFFLSIPLFHKIYDKTIKRIESIIVKQ
jgi:fucose 4-O-acetylase-like acetyltransferase